MKVFFAALAAFGVVVAASDKVFVGKAEEVMPLHQNTCDGPNFQCNFTAGNITNINGVNFTTPSGTYLPGEIATLVLYGQLAGDVDVDAGTTHYTVWEGGVAHFRVNGGSCVLLLTWHAGCLVLQAWRTTYAGDNTRERIRTRLSHFAPPAAHFAVVLRFAARTCHDTTPHSDYFECGPAPAGCDKTKPISLFIDDPTNTTSLCHINVSFPLPDAMVSGIFTVDFYGADEYHEPYDFIVNLAYHY